MQFNKNISAVYKLVTLVLCVVMGGTLVACGPAQPKTVTIGIVNLLPMMDTIVEGFKTGMVELGYSEEQSVTYVYAEVPGDFEMDKIVGATQELMKEDVDLILAITTPGSLAVQKAVEGTDTPVIFVAVTDPVAVGLVQDWIHPGGNITGVTTAAKGAVNEGRRLEWLTKMLPNVKRVYIPHNPDDGAVKTSLAVVRDAASALGIELVLRETRTAEEALNAINETPKDVDALFLLPDSVVTSVFEDALSVLLGRRLPVSTPNSLGPNLGALMSYGSEFPAMGKQASRLAGQILEGTNPADLPVEAPEFFLTINLRTAKAIGLEIPDEILNQADTVIR